MAYVDHLLGPGETIQHVTHQHVLFLMGRILGRVLLAIVLIAVGVTGKVLLANRPEAWHTMAGNAFIFVAIILALVPLIQAFGRTLEWRNEEFVVTNRRVIRVQGVFGKKTVDSSLNQINDLLTNQSFFGRIAGYGDVRIVTGNDVADEAYRGLADPLGFKRALLGARDDFLRDLNSYHGAPAVAAQPEFDPATIPTLIAQLADLHARGAISKHEYDTKRAELLRRL